ncbi:cobalamin-binding protein [Edaphobacter acidisoli]|uniref:Cobalamin-binding protein n=1 Tax=Edaphobacter acidisoli TaxID=2040573 RepID=A0A916RIP3_9BACT|nr:ABC transporter substrate-binding protein [Edaphobacter acidisoli]GGA57541.1 cobalamin-binding protein [Edaphobacter acidisoli]
MAATRIASLQPSITLTLQALGRLDRLVACTRYCLEALPELAARNLPILHDSWSADTAEILAAHPDLVVASVPYRLESLAAILKTGIPVLALTPHTLADIYKDINLLAGIVEAEDEGRVLVARMREAIDLTRQRSAPRRRTPLVYCEEWGKPLIHSQHWVAELVEAAGGRFLGEPGAHTTPEAVAEANPDVLLFAWCGAGDRVPLDRVVAQRNWFDLPAVRHARVYCIPDEYLNTPAHTLLEGLHSIAAAIHPEIFPSHPRLIQLTGAAESSDQDLVQSSVSSVG